MRTVLFIAVVLCALSAALGDITVVFDGGSSGTKIIAMGDANAGECVAPSPFACVENFKLAKSLHDTFPASGYAAEDPSKACAYSLKFGKKGVDVADQCNSARNYARSLLAKKYGGVRGSPVTNTLFMATAGMRSISIGAANAVIAEVATVFEKGHGNHGLEVTAGTKEAFYEWFTVNYGIAQGKASDFLVNNPSGHFGIGGLSAQISLLLEGGELVAWDAFVSSLTIGTDFVAIPPTGTKNDYARLFTFVTPKKAYNVATISYMGLRETVPGIGNMNFAGGTDAVQARSGCSALNSAATDVVAKCKNAVITGINNDPFATKFNRFFKTNFNSLSTGRKLTLITNANIEATIGRWKLVPSPSVAYAYSSTTTHLYQGLIDTNCKCTRMCAHAFGAIQLLRGMGLLSDNGAQDTAVEGRLAFVQTANAIPSGFSDDWAVGAAVLRAFDDSGAGAPVYLSNKAKWGIKPVANINSAAFPVQLDTTSSNAVISGCPSSLVFDGDNYDADDHHTNFKAYKEYIANAKQFNEFKEFMQGEEMNREQQRQSQQYQEQLSQQQQEQEQQTSLVQVKETEKAAAAASSDDSDLSDAESSPATSD